MLITVIDHIMLQYVQNNYSEKVSRPLESSIINWGKSKV